MLQTCWRYGMSVVSAWVKCSLSWEISYFCITYKEWLCGYHFNWCLAKEATHEMFIASESNWDRGWHGAIPCFASYTISLERAQKSHSKRESRFHQIIVKSAILQKLKNKFKAWRVNLRGSTPLSLQNWIKGVANIVYIWTLKHNIHNLWKWKAAIDN